MTHRATLGLAVLTLVLGLACSGSSGEDDESSGGSRSGSGGSSSAGQGGSGGSGGSGATAGSSAAGSAGSTGGNLSGGSGGGAGASGGSAGAYDCGVQFSSLDKSCDDAADCVLVNHMTNCCGDTLRMAINEAEQQEFSALESYCSAQFPACGCAAQGVSAEDGSLVQFGSEDSIVAECAEGRCQSRHGGATFACADRVCTEQQYCTIVIGGPAGSEPSGTCSFEAGCGDCSCHQTVGCDCADQDGHVTVTCAAP